jgi:hypothetical protein
MTAQVEIKAGGMYTFPKGMSCTWEVRSLMENPGHFGKYSWLPVVFTPEAANESPLTSAGARVH